MLRNISRFLALTGREKRLLFEAFCLLGIMRAAIMTISFKRLTRSLEHAKEKIDIVPLTFEQQQTAILIGKAIERAARYTPWESACLAQAMTAQRMLRLRNIPGIFYLGAKKEGSGAEKMHAHAWTQCGTEIITGRQGHESFTVLSVFGWQNR